MDKDEKIKVINKVVKNYFNNNPEENKILAKDLMHLFLAAGIFTSNHRNGLPLRNLFRDMDAKNELHRITFLLAERKTRNTNWYFIQSNKTIKNSPKLVNKADKEKIISKTKHQKNKLDVLHDLLQPNLDIVFCGTAVGNKSADTKAYYAGSGNKFYSILHKTGLTPVQLKPHKYQKLLQYNIGLTDMVKHTSGNDNVLKQNDFDVADFNNKILKYQPKIVCFNGKTAAAVFIYNNKSKTSHIPYGWLKTKIGQTRLFVAPSTSGSANAFWDENYWFKLKKGVI